MYLIYLILCVLIFCGCTGDLINHPSLNNVNRVYAKQLKAIEPSSNIAGVGGMFMVFHLQKHMNLSEARVFYVQQMETLLSILKDYPDTPLLDPEDVFSNNGIYLCFEFKDNSNCIFVEPPYIANLSMCNNKIYYSIRSSYDLDWTETIHSEPYEEALRIVREQGYLLNLNKSVIL